MTIDCKLHLVQPHLAQLLNYVSCVLFEEVVGVIWHLSLCLLMPAVSSTMLASMKSASHPSFHHPK